MKKIQIVSKVVGRETEGKPVSSTGNVYIQQAVSDSKWEERTDSEGSTYLYTTYPVVTQGGVTMYAGMDGVEVPGLYDGIPIDGQTIQWETDSDGNKKLVSVSSDGGGSIEYPLTWTGRASGSYDGSEEASIYLPSKLSEFTDDVVSGYYLKANGDGATGTWGISITGSSTSCTGNSATASKLSSSVILWGNTFNGTSSIAGDIHLNGNGNYGNAIYFGDGTYCYIKESSDDYMYVYARAGVELNVGSGYNIYLNGSVLTSSGITMYSQRSLKDVVDERGLSLDELKTIKPTRYTWKDKRDEKVHIGGIADDVQKVLPEVIYETNEGILTMDYANAGFAVAASLVEPVVAHDDEIKALKKEVETLKRIIEQLKRE